MLPQLESLAEETLNFSLQCDSGARIQPPEQSEPLLEVICLMTITSAAIAILDSAQIGYPFWVQSEQEPQQAFIF